MRLLVVDDNTRFLEAATRLLECEGMTVVATAATTGEALRHAGDLCPEVALVDVDLGWESGFDLARRLADVGAGHGIAVILISAYPEQDFAELMEGSPAVGFLSKSDLSGAAIRALLGQAGA
ncbi:MAG TPA: response regulator [Actinomycetota bacterium]|nr:response regulator [Actinomycetota bacterium]